MRSSCGNPVSLTRLKSTVDSVYEPFRGSRPQDSHEFLMKVLEFLGEDLGTPVPGSSPSQFSSGSCEVVGREGVSNFENTFLCLHRSRIKCGSCLCISATFEPFTAISLSFPVGYFSLEDLVHNYYGETYECMSVHNDDIRSLPPAAFVYVSCHQY